MFHCTSVSLLFISLSQLSNFLKLLPVDGIWLDMNEASNFCAGECPGYAYTADTEPFCTNGKCADTASSKRPGFNPNNPPYDIHNQGSQSTPLKIKTLDVDAQHYGGVLEYDAHSIYGKCGSHLSALSLIVLRAHSSSVALRQCSSDADIGMAPPGFPRLLIAASDLKAGAAIKSLGGLGTRLGMASYRDLSAVMYVYAYLLFHTK